MRTTTLLLAAAVLFAGIGSASACSYGNTDIAVDGKGNVVELVDNGYGNQVTGSILGSYHSLQSKIRGKCNVIVTKQSGAFTSIGTIIKGNGQKVGVLLRNGAVVDLKAIGNRNKILIDAQGNVDMSVIGTDNSVYVKT